MPVALALSPHLDDAAFSCGGTLATLAEAGWKVVMATIFTATVADPKGFALACQTDKGLAPEIDYMALRRDEDRRAAEALGIAPPLHLPFREAPHRGYGAAPELFADPRRDDDIVDALGAAVSRLVGDVSPDLVLAPQAVGGHVDHVQLVRAISQVRWTVPILWWRDFPIPFAMLRRRNRSRAISIGCRSARVAIPRWPRRGRGPPVRPMRRSSRSSSVALKG